MTGRATAILVKRFPKLSETFILNEVLGLEARGRALRIFTLEPPYDEAINPAAARVRAPIERIIGATYADIATLLLRPLSFARGLAVAAQEFGLRDWGAVSQALALACRLRDKDIGHLHAHFADRPAAIARVAAIMAGKPFSISAHAKDIYTEAPARLPPRLRDARFTVTCTGHNAEYLKALAPAARVKRLYHGVDLEALGAPVRQQTGDAPLILSVGRLRAKKGFDTLIEACAALHAAGKEFRCIIAGYGPEEAALRALITARGLDARVELAGKLAHHSILALMRRARVFALPCRVEADGDRDGIPNVLLEAMALGAPVVSTNISGIPELIEPGENGLLIAPGDSAALAEAVNSVLGDESLAQRLADKARKTIEARFSLDGDIALLDALLRESLNGAPTRPHVAYVLKGFPRLSESFISNEVRLLEEMGLPIHIFAIKRGDELGRPVLAQIDARVTYLPAMTSISGAPLWLWMAHNLPSYLGACLHLALIRPGSFFKTLSGAVVMTRRYRDRENGRARKVFIKEFLQGAYIASQASRLGDVAHLHGHFCHGATTVTQFVSGLLGLPFSFTAHAKDIYETKLNPGDLLDRKFASARFSVTCTGANQQHLKARGCDCGSLHTIYHGLDTNLFKPSSPPSATAPPLILAVGRYVEKKGFLDLISACAILRQRGVAFRCRIVGEDGAAGDAMRALIVKEDLGARVTLAPPAPQRQLRDIYAEASVFALPCLVTESGDRDGIPNVLAEAMAMQLPVVTTDVSGIPELVRDGENGRIVPPADVAALAAALEDVLVGPPESQRALGRAARATIEACFDSRKTTRALKTLFDEALAEAAA